MNSYAEMTPMLAGSLARDEDRRRGKEAIWNDCSGLLHCVPGWYPCPAVIEIRSAHIALGLAIVRLPFHYRRHGRDSAWDDYREIEKLD
jgi:hypothetical protein